MINIGKVHAAYYGCVRLASLGRPQECVLATPTKRHNQYGNRAHNSVIVQSEQQNQRPTTETVFGWGRQNALQGLFSNLGLGSGSGSACRYNQQYALKMQVRGRAAYTQHAEPKPEPEPKPWFEKGLRGRFHKGLKFIVTSNQS